MFNRSLTILEKSLGRQHPYVGIAFGSIAELYEFRVATMMHYHSLEALRRWVWLRKSTYLAVLTGAAHQSSISNTDAFSESYEVVQRATSTAASKAVNQLAVRFAAGNDQLAQLVRKDQDLSFENDALDKLIVEAASKEPFSRDAVSEQQIRDRLRAIASEASPD